jgi:AraC-like DNA-binding protein
MLVEVARAGCEASGYEVATAPLPPPLAPFVASWLGYREWSAAPVVRLEYPTGRAVLIFEIGAPIAIGATDGATRHHRAGFFAGLDDAPTFTRFAGEQAGVQVTLTPRGAHALAARPMHELSGQVVDVAELSLPTSLCARLAEAPGWPARFAIVAAALERRLLAAPSPSPLIGWALERIDARGGALRIAALAAELGYSRKHLHERFLREVGLPPKRYAEVRRFDRVLARLRAAPAGAPASLARLAAELGYADQAHLARDVRRFSSQSARALAQTLQDPLGLAIEQLAGR